MTSFEIVNNGTVKVTIRRTPSGAIEIVRESADGIAIYFDSPQDAIRRWQIWTLGSDLIAR
jgi:hypothetical protein